ncbi:MAG: HlyD family efflux transporter periplasmic adaptor subunit [Bacteroidota bacterium]
MNPENSKELINIRSEEVDEILTRKPRWVVRWGIMTILIVIVLILVCSYFIRYPDIISTHIVITTENIPVNLVPKSGGKISQLYVKDRQEVKAGEIIAIIENPANYNDVFRLDSLLKALSFLKKSNTGLAASTDIDSIETNSTYILGELQQPYANFVKSLNDYKLYIITDFNHKKINALRAQSGKYRELQSRLMSQSNIILQQLELAKSQYARDSLLFAGKAIPAAELEKSKGGLLQNRYSWMSARGSVDNARISVLQIEQNILELEQQYQEQKTKMVNDISDNYEILLNQVSTWYQTYILKSPIDGKITFTKYWSANQDIKPGEVAFTIVPAGSAKIIGKTELPAAGAGKVREGQKVNVKIDNYPYMEYGMVSGLVGTLSLVPNQKLYTVEIIFPDGLKTNYKRELPFGQQMEGSADIITDNLRLIERFFNPVKALWKNIAE